VMTGGECEHRIIRIQGELTCWTMPS
jgi:hypothetical protein